MKNLLLVLSVTLMTLSSCSREEVEVCGTVQDDAIEYFGGNLHYTLTIDGRTHYVTSDEWANGHIGDYYCVTVWD